MSTDEDQQWTIISVFTDDYVDGNVGNKSLERSFISVRRT